MNEDLKNFINYIENCREEVLKNGRKPLRDPHFSYHDGLALGYSICVEMIKEILEKHEIKDKCEDFLDFERSLFDYLEIIKEK